MVGGLFDWLMSDQKTESVTIRTALSPDDIRDRIRGQVIESHNIMMFGVLAIFLFRSQRLMGFVEGDFFELGFISPLGPGITGRITGGEQPGITFKSGLNVMVSLAPIMFGVFLVLGLIFGLIIAVFIPRTLPAIAYTLLAFFGAFIFAVAVKAICVKSLRRQHERHIAFFENLLK